MRASNQDLLELGLDCGEDPRLPGEMRAGWYDWTRGAKRVWYTGTDRHTKRRTDIKGCLSDQQTKGLNRHEQFIPLGYTKGLK